MGEFPTGNGALLTSLFLSVELGLSLSRIWRAIMDGKNVLEQGLICRINIDEDTFV